LATALFLLIAKGGYAKYFYARVKGAGKVVMDELLSAARKFLKCTDAVETCETRLPNGVRVVTDAMPSADKVGIAVGIGAGWGSEIAGIDKPGVAHFLEHMVFKGSCTRDGHEFESKEEMRRFARHQDCFIDAGTYKTHTLFDGIVSPQDVEDALIYLSSVVCRPVLDDVQIELEKKPILNEWLRDRLLKRCEDSAPHRVFGTREAVLSMSRSELLSFHAANYISGNAVVFAAGNVDHEAIVKTVEKEFFLSSVACPRRALLEAPSNAETDFPRGTRVTVVFGTGDQGEPEDFPLLSQILGKAPHDVLRRKLRDEKGLLYGLDCQPEGERLKIVFVSPFEDISPCLEQVNACLRDLRSGGLGFLEQGERKKVCQTIDQLLMQPPSVDFWGDNGALPSFEDVKAIFSSDAIRPQAGKPRSVKNRVP
jgi:predicted Zn-dependent peptidase